MEMEFLYRSFLCVVGWFCLKLEKRNDRQSENFLCPHRDTNGRPPGRRESALSIRPQRPLMRAETFVQIALKTLGHIDLENNKFP